MKLIFGDRVRCVITFGGIFDWGGLALGGGHCENFLSGILMIYAYCYAYFN